MFNYIRVTLFSFNYFGNIRKEGDPVSEIPSRRVVFIGGSGTGKSTTIDSFLKHVNEGEGEYDRIHNEGKAPETVYNMVPGTAHVSLYQARFKVNESNGGVVYKSVALYDTPGFFEDKDDNIPVARLLRTIPISANTKFIITLNNGVIQRRLFNTIRNVIQELHTDHGISTFYCLITGIKPSSNFLSQITERVAELESSGVTIKYCCLLHPQMIEQYLQKDQYAQLIGEYFNEVYDIIMQTSHKFRFINVSSN
jgi:GTPase SAR1 family protein